jgi:hypothetical protein
MSIVICPIHLPPKTACIIEPVCYSTNRLQKAISLGNAPVADLIMWNLMTLDGFVEGPNRDMNAAPKSSGIVILRYAPRN